MQVRDEMMAEQTFALTVTTRRAASAPIRTPRCYVLRDDLGLDGPKYVVTIEGLGDERHPGRLEQAFIAEQAVQCYCIPGMIMSAAALLAANPQPSDGQIRADAVRWNKRSAGTYSLLVAMVERPLEDATGRVGVNHVGLSPYAGAQQLATFKEQVDKQLNDAQRLRLALIKR